MTDVQVTLAGVTMNNDVPDTQGVLWHAGDLDGWDSPAVRLDDEERTGRHGAFGPSRLYGARVLTLPGVAECPSLASAFAVRERLHLMVGMDSPVELVVHEPAPKSLQVMAGGPVRASVPIDAFPFAVTWQLPLLARDPFKRSLTATTTPLAASSAVTIPSPGTAPADLRVTVTSPGTVVLSAGGLTLTTTTLPVGAVIDTGAASITALDGSDLFAAVPVTVAPQWPALPKGGGPVTQAGTAALSIEHFDTYA